MAVPGTWYLYLDCQYLISYLHRFKFHIALIKFVEELQSTDTLEKDGIHEATYPSRQWPKASAWTAGDGTLTDISFVAFLLRLFLTLFFAGKVHCTGYGKNRDLSEKFWSTKDPGQQPFTFSVGLGQVIRGWDESVIDMSLGEIAKIHCSPDYAYGAGASLHGASNPIVSSCLKSKC